jgi:hypothetical protein
MMLRIIHGKLKPGTWDYSGDRHIIHRARRFESDRRG